MKNVYALTAGVAFGIFVGWMFVFAASLNGRSVENWVNFLVGPVFAGLFLASTLLFIDKIKSK